MLATRLLSLKKRKLCLSRISNGKRRKRFIGNCQATGLENEGENCWYKCDRRQGKCSWCGTKGYCCRKDWATGNGCDGTFGGDGRHECSLKPVTNSKTPTFILNELSSHGREAHDSGVRKCNSLENLVNNHRQANGLNPISCHDKPRYLAKMHVFDLRQADPSCKGNLHEWKSTRYTDGRPCSKLNCQILKYHLGERFAASNPMNDGGVWEISVGGKDSDNARFLSWKNSPGHNKIMLTKDGDQHVFGCYNNPSQEYSHCIFYALPKHDYPTPCEKEFSRI